MRGTDTNDQIQTILLITFLGVDLRIMNIVSKIKIYWQNKKLFCSGPNSKTYKDTSVKYSYI